MKMNNIVNKLRLEASKSDMCHKHACVAIKHGDRLVPIISAASIIAKVTRDKIMHEIDREYPVYNFKQHKGYGTKQHIEMIKKHGICKYHRKTFRPISQL